MKKQEKQKGITLVALVVTIIILLILAGVALAFTFGNDGIINKSKEAVQKHNQAVGTEETELNKVEGIMDEYMGATGENLQDYVTLNLESYVGKFIRQNVDYMEMKVKITDADDKDDYIIIPVGIDWKSAVLKQDANHLFANSADNTMEMIFNIARDKSHQADATTMDYASLNAFTDVNLKWKVKKGKKYIVSITIQKAKVDATNKTVTAEDLELFTSTTDVLTQDATIKNDTYQWKLFDMDSNGSMNTSDLIAISQVLSNILSDKVVIIQNHSSSLNPYKAILLKQADGTLDPTMKQYLGLDLNRDGTIDGNDSKLIDLANSNKY